MPNAPGWRERELRGASELAARRALLASRGLSEPGDEDLVLGLYDEEQLVATGALAGQVVVGVAVERSVEGEGAAAAILSSLIARAVSAGTNHLFLFTKTEEAGRFSELGFAQIASVPGGAALLEWGRPSLADWLKGLASAAEGRPRDAGAVVVNCNPFTLGHRRLIEYAAERSPWLYVLVVEEDRSLFPFQVRLELVSEGTADIPNLSVHPGGPYIVSSATFPSYFARPAAADAPDPVAIMHAELDLAVFRRHIAPALGVSHRYVGTEPYCRTTAVYNEAMKRILPAKGEGWAGPPVTVAELPRLELDGEAVSASRVRELIRRGRMAEAKPLLPPTTWRWLESQAALPVLERIRSSDSRH